MSITAPQVVALRDRAYEQTVPARGVKDDAGPLWVRTSHALIGSISQFADVVEHQGSLNLGGRNPGNLKSYDDVYSLLDGAVEESSRARTDQAYRTPDTALVVLGLARAAYGVLHNRAITRADFMGGAPGDWPFSIAENDFKLGPIGAKGRDILTREYKARTLLNLDHGTMAELEPHDRRVKVAAAGYLSSAQEAIEHARAYLSIRISEAEDPLQFAEALLLPHAGEVWGEG
jgi:hypothetical protein